MVEKKRQLSSQFEFFTPIDNHLPRHAAAENDARQNPRREIEIKILRNMTDIDNKKRRQSGDISRHHSD